MIMLAPNPVLTTEETRIIAAACATLIDRSILTLAALPDPDRRYTHNKTTFWPEFARSVYEAYGYSSPRVRRFRPSPRDVELMLPVLKWVAWLSRQKDGDRYVSVLTSKAFDVSWEAMGDKFRVSERTIRRWYDAAVAMIVGEYHRELAELFT